MAEYIKREYAVDAVLDVYYDTPDIDLSGEKFEAAIRKIQAADVAQARHGRWDKDGCCTVCGEEAIYYWERSTHVYTDYCPNYGAKMDLKGEDHED